MDVRPFWFLVAGLILLYIFVLAFVEIPRRRRHATGLLPIEPSSGTWLGPGGTQRLWGAEGFLDAGAVDQPTFFMVGVDWCPHCVKAKPIFQSLGSKVTIGGRDVALQYLDGEKDKARLPCEVGGFPTFCFLHRGRAQRYQGPRSVEGFRQFLTEQLAASV
jgi:thiol-disulfide isomerase/thioredoxin